MLQISVEGQQALAERLGVLPDRLRAALAEKVDALAQNLFSQVVGVNLSGGVLNARSGALRDSIQVALSQQDDRIDAEIFSNGDAPYAAIQEFGGKTAAHEILPDKARVLAFVANGKQLFARRVQHPGSQIPARSYLRSALDEQGENILLDLTEIVRALAGDLKDVQ
jgi:phage gpG-like protein